MQMKDRTEVGILPLRPLCISLFPKATCPASSTFLNYMNEILLTQRFMHCNQVRNDVIVVPLFSRYVLRPKRINSDKFGKRGLSTTGVAVAVAIVVVAAAAAVVVIIVVVVVVDADHSGSPL
jgi:hypothetical protein